METIVVIGGGALALLGMVRLISECLQGEGDSASAPAQIACDRLVARTAAHSARLATAPVTGG
jgi:hypothetical protein